MNYELYKIDKTSQKRTKIETVKNLHWEDNLENVFISFSFTSPEVLECGDIIELYNTRDDITVWFGVIFTTNQTELEEYNYSGYDAGIYLYKNELTVQFKNAEFKTILEKVCEKCELIPGDNPQTEVKYTNIFRKETAEKILKKAYENLVKNGLADIYYFDCKDGKINLKQYQQSNDLKGTIIEFGNIDSFKFIKKFKLTHSVEEMKNHVEVFKNESVNKKNTDKPDGMAESQTSIQKYGLLRYTEDLSKDSKEKPQTVAEETLLKLNKVKRTKELTVFADYKLQKGLKTYIDEERLNLKATYKVLSSKHTINQIDEEVTITIEELVEEN